MEKLVSEIQSLNINLALIYVTMKSKKISELHFINLGCQDYMKSTRPKYILKGYDDGV